MAELMRALVKSAPGVDSVVVMTIPKPKPSSGQVLIEVGAAGVCGTDLHIIDGSYTSRPPVVLGHEVAGTVVDVGPGAASTWIGARVACQTQHQVCDCEYCQTDRRNLCDRRESMGSFVNGGFAKWLTCAETLVHRLPVGLSIQAGALLEPLACVTHLLLDPPIVNVGDRVLVTGPGPMGLIAAQVARAAGAEVVVSGRPSDDMRLGIASALGLVAVSELPKLEFDVVIECSGSEAGARSALNAARKSGRYVSVGIHGRDITLPFDLVLYKELTISSGFASTRRSWQRALALLRNSVVDLESLITAVEPLDHWETVFSNLREGVGMKTIFDPSLSD